MSKGPGHAERAITAALAAEPDNAFNIEDLCDRAYPDVKAEKKHRVTVLRAIGRILARRPDLKTFLGDGIGRPKVVFHRYNVMSYAMARLKADFRYSYRSNDPRKSKRWIKDEAELRASLREGGKNYKYIVIERGAWWNHMQQSNCRT